MGPFNLDDAITLEELAGTGSSSFCPWMPHSTFRPDPRRRKRTGSSTGSRPVAAEEDGLARVYGPKGFLGVGRVAQGKTKYCRPVKVLVDP